MEAIRCEKCGENYATSFYYKIALCDYCESEITDQENQKAKDEEFSHEN